MERTLSDALFHNSRVEDIKGLFTVQALVQYYNLWQLVIETHLSPEESDQFAWKFTPNAQYSSRSSLLCFVSNIVYVLGWVWTSSCIRCG